MSPMECDVVKFIDNTLLLLEQMRNKPEWVENYTTLDHGIYADMYMYYSSTLNVYIYVMWSSPTSYCASHSMVFFSRVWSKISVFVASLKVLKEKMARPHSQSFPTTPTAVAGSGLQQNSGIIVSGYNST